MIQNYDENVCALERMRAATPHLTGMVMARDALGLTDGELGHAGPPFEPGERPPPPVLNALAAGTVLEGWARDEEQGRRLILSGDVRLRPNHELGTVSPMTGLVRPTQPLMRVANRTGDGVTYATFAESGRRALRFGCFDSKIQMALDELEKDIAPAIAHALPRGGLDIWPLISAGILGGDDIHQRNVAAMGAFLEHLDGLADRHRQWLKNNPQHFLNYAMAGVKLTLDQARDVPGSSLVVALSRNGLRCGIQVSGTGDRWFTAPATIPRGWLFNGIETSQVQPDLGDSAIVEVAGLGGGAAHTAHILNQDMGVEQERASSIARRQRGYFISSNPWIQGEGFDLGMGLDARRVADDNGMVSIHTGIAHADGKTGWVGIGVAQAPTACFRDAMTSLELAQEHYHVYE
jgi:hypothetical protein